MPFLLFTKIAIAAATPLVVEVALAVFSEVVAQFSGLQLGLSAQILAQSQDYSLDQACILLHNLLVYKLAVCAEANSALTTNKKEYPKDKIKDFMENEFLKFTGIAELASKVSLQR
ncbi:MAG: hypothetical protein IPJ74_11915 [Saprospiraceae bacterium]|nr:hypothetical protein [Saprospiraceae bacterium]